VTAYGDDAGFCTIAKLWAQFGTDAVVPVACFDNTGRPKAAEFNATFSSNI
jgi:hypothetical protein